MTKSWTFTLPLMVLRNPAPTSVGAPLSELQIAERGLEHGFAGVRTQGQKIRGVAHNSEGENA